MYNSLKGCALASHSPIAAAALAEGKLGLDCDEDRYLAQVIKLNEMNKNSISYLHLYLMHLSIHQSIYPSIYISIYIYLSINLSVAIFYFNKALLPALDPRVYDAVFITVGTSTAALRCGGGGGDITLSSSSAVPGLGTCICL